MMELPGVIRKDRWDRRQYAALRDQSSILANLEERLREHIPGPLVEDTWAALFKVRPELLDQEEISLQELLLHQVMQSLLATPEYHETRQWTRLDEWASALGAAHLGRKVEEWLQEWRKQQAQGGGAGAGGQTPGEPGQATGQPGQSGGQPRAQANAAAGRQQAGGQPGALPVRALQERLREGLAELSSVGGLLWGTGPGQPRRVDGRQVELAHRLLQDKTFRRMARMAGRMYTAALARKLARGRDAVVPAGIRLGSDLGRVLPEELVGLRHPALRRDFLLRYAEGRLRQLDVRVAQQERGPIVCCVDTSGSMQGTKHEWAKAVALALLRVARRERRSFSGIVFASEAEGPFRLAPGTPRDIETFTHIYLGGGTNFWPPLQLALQVIDEQRRADVVFITDGHAPISAWLDQFLSKKRRLGFRVFGVFIPSSSDSSSNDTGLGALRRFSDEVLVVNPTPDGQGLELLFDQV